MNKFLSGLFLCSCIISGSYCQLSGPQPGDIYKEFVLNLISNNNWRVTDPDAGASGARAFLPNPVMTIQIDDLDGAIRAEALMDIWGGHAGTTGKKFRFNANTWIDIPDHPTIPENPECYNSEFNYITAVPLSHLHAGYNTFEGTSGGQTCFNFDWGQWGWYVMVVRIYYGPEKLHPTGRIASHPSGSDVIEQDTIMVDAYSSVGIKQVDLLGKYMGYDENGDGIYLDWHRNYHTPALEGHIGSAKNPPYKFVWDNQWIPDQAPESVSFLARIQDSSNVWCVTEIVDNISLVRPEGVSVKMFTAEDVPQKFWVRAGQQKFCYINIDDMSNATNARLIHRTWNGRDGYAGSGTVENPLSVNTWQGRVGGVSHNYALSRVTVPVKSLKEGSNRVGYHSSTVHHGIEILWPGPAILIRYNMNAPQVETPVISPTPGEYHIPVKISISCETSGADIYYTTAGTDPNNGSSKYNTAFHIRDSATVIAMATRFDYRPSEMAQHHYSRYHFPFLLDVCKGEDPNTVEIEFNKPVDKASVEDLLNYSLNNGGIITKATMDPGDSIKIVLTVEGMEEGAEYRITVNNVLDNTGTSIPLNSSLSFIYAYFIEITTSDANNEHLAENTMDGDLSTYWSAYGTSGVWIQYDLRTFRLVRSVDIAFYLGTLSKSYFIIQTSLDGINWTEVYNGENSKYTLEPQEFDFEDVMARYVRILGLGNSSCNWNIYTEVQINWQWETYFSDEQTAEELSVYPVPASHGFYVELPSWQEKDDIFFINTMGQKSQAILHADASWISTSNLETGVYLLVIQTDKKILQTKILVLKE